MQELNEIVDVSSARRSRAPAVNRAAAILDLLADHGGVPMGATALSRALGLPKASVINICNALVDVGLARRRGGGYVLGSRVVTLSAAYLSGLDLVREFHEACDEFQAAAGQTIQLAVLGEGLEVVYMARRIGRQPVRLVSDIGRRLPAHCTATGKALLAAMDPAALADRLPSNGLLTGLTARSITNVGDLMHELDDVRRQGYGVDREETADGAVCVAAAIPGQIPGELAPAVGITVLAGFTPPQRISELGGWVRAIAADLARRLGA